MAKRLADAWSSAEVDTELPVVILEPLLLGFQPGKELLRVGP